MANFTPSKKTAQDFNGGVKYVGYNPQTGALGDTIYIETTNDLVESALYSQQEAESAVTTANNALSKTENIKKYYSIRLTVTTLNIRKEENDNVVAQCILMHGIVSDNTKLVGGTVLTMVTRSGSGIFEVIDTDNEYAHGYLYLGASTIEAYFLMDGTIEFVEI